MRLRGKGWAVMALCPGFGTGVIVVFAYHAWRSVRHRSATSAPADPCVSGKKLASRGEDEIGEIVAPYLGEVESENPFRPELRRDPEMFGPPKLIPLLPGIGDGEVVKRGLSLEENRLQGEFRPLEPKDSQPATDAALLNLSQTPSPSSQLRNSPQAPEDALLR